MLFSETHYGIIVLLVALIAQYTSAVHVIYCALNLCQQPFSLRARASQPHVHANSEN